VAVFDATLRPVVRLRHGNEEGSRQMTDEPKPTDAPGNLFAPVPGDYGAHGRFGHQAPNESREMVTSRHRDALALAVVALVILAARRPLHRRW